MIKISQVSTTNGEIVLKVQYDRDGQVQTVDIRKQDLIDRLKLVRQTLGRSITLVDLKQVIVAVINELRSGKKPLSEDFDYPSFIGVDLEA
jgi:hypothetical protein